MNSILARQLDPNKVYDQLDQISAAIDNIGDTFNTAINPLDDAPPETTQKLKQFDRLQAECMAFSSGWSNALTTINQDFTQQISGASSQNDFRAATGRQRDATDALNKKNAAEYERSLGPELAKAQNELVRLLPGRAVKDLSGVRYVTQISSICLDYTLLLAGYKNQLEEDLRKKEKESRSNR